MESWYIESTTIAVIWLDANVDVSDVVCAPRNKEGSRHRKPSMVFFIGDLFKRFRQMMKLKIKHKYERNKYFAEIPTR